MHTKKLIVDCDPGIDDALALTIALFSPAVELVAATAVGGNVPPDQATRNLQAILEQLDPPRRPRLGAASPPDDGWPAHSRRLHGPDGLGGANFQVAELHQRHPSEKIIADEIRAAPQQVTVLTLGPLTNLSRALQRDPALASQIDQVVMMGGSGNGIGSVTAAAEFNVYCDPPAARAVFRAATTKILVPIDVSGQVVFSFDLLDALPPESTRAGRLLRKVVPYAFRAYRQELGLESIFLHDAVALVAALHPELFEVQMVAADVELSGELTTGATVFDRRRQPEWRPNLYLAVGVDAAAVADCILRGLKSAGEATASDR
jgi:purine nucleosidase